MTKRTEEEDVTFRGTPLHVSNRFDAFGEDENGDFLRPLPAKRLAKADQKAKRKPTEKFIRADYSYEYTFDDASSAHGTLKGSKGHKQQPRHRRVDLAVELEKLSVDDLKLALARLPEDASAAQRYIALVEELEHSLLHARQAKFETNAEQWESFNSPYGETSDDVLEFLSHFVATELEPADRSLASRHITSRLIKNVNAPTNASAGFGYRLGAQILFREFAWPLVEAIGPIKASFPKINLASSSSQISSSGSNAGNVNSVPANCVPTVVFIGAQLLANEEDPDARYVALSYALEVLGYAALHGNESLAAEFLARAFVRYHKAHGLNIDPAYTRLSTSVALRVLHDLNKIQERVRKDPAVLKNKTSPHATLFPYIAGLKQLVAHMALLSASPTRAIEIFKLLASTDPALASHLLPLLYTSKVSAYDKTTQQASVQLAKDIAKEMAKLTSGSSSASRSKSSKDNQAPLELTPELEKAISEFLDDHKIDATKLAGTSAASLSGKSKGGKSKNGHHHKHRREAGGCFARFVWRTLLFIAFVYLGIYLYRHYVPAEGKRVINLLLKPYEKHVDTARTFAQPHIDTAISAHNAYLQPHIDTATTYVQPYYDAAYATARPLYDEVVTTSAPYIDLAFKKSAEAASAASDASQKAYIASLPAIYAILDYIRAALAAIGRQADAFGQNVTEFNAKHVAPLVKEHVTPIVNSACDAINPHLEPVQKAVRPYYEAAVKKFFEAGKWIDAHAKLD